MYEKGWTREQIGRLTLSDLRVMVLEHAPPEPWAPQPRRILSPEDFTRALAERNAERNSWES
jgi:hypothetical protein